MAVSALAAGATMGVRQRPAPVVLSVGCGATRSDRADRTGRPGRRAASGGSGVAGVDAGGGAGDGLPRVAVGEQLGAVLAHLVGEVVVVEHHLDAGRQL